MKKCKNYTLECDNANTCPCLLYDEGLILTKEEDELTTYCKDFCPIYYAVENYNRDSYRDSDTCTTLFCPTEMCEAVTKTYIFRRRREKMKEKYHEVKDVFF